ncbi:MHC class II transactivator isoform X2 [Scomber scombrus]|uniref:MHC class II transactivator isoform X2 n=1 Tax=Scomber scombrus TaxID=13677 RepID=A0AAV1NUX9_SCOSC
MAQFEEVLGGVRLALTWASLAEIKAMLEGLVEEQIISEAYRKSLSLHRFIEGIAPETIHSQSTCKAGSDKLEIHSQESTAHWQQDQWGQVRKYGLSTSRESAITIHDQLRSEDEHNSTWSKPNLHPLYGSVSQGHNPKLIQELSHWMSSRGPVMDEHYTSHRIVRVSDNERVDESNSEDEKEWLEQVEEAARRIAVPLWQHWDRGERMLLPLLPCVTAVCSASAKRASDAPCPVSDMEDQTELAVACQMLDLYTDSMEVKITNTSLTLDTEGATYSLKGHCFSMYDNVAATELNTDHFNICETTDTALNASPVEARAADEYENEDKERLDSHWDTKMQEEEQNLPPYSDLEDLQVTEMHEVEQDLPPDPNFGDLPDLSEFLNDDYLRKFMEQEDTEILFGDPWLNGVDVNNNNNNCDIITTTALPSAESHQQEQQHNVTSKTNHRSKRPRAPRSQPCTEGNMPTRAKRQRAAGRAKTKKAQTEPAVTQGSDMGSEPIPAETAGLSTSPPRILQFHSPIQFITIPDTPGYQVVQTLSLSPPVILPLPNTAAAPTYIFVPAPSPPRNLQVPPLSPVDGAVAPVQMSSSPPGSLSDTASKAMSPLCASPLSPSNETSPCKESPVPQSPTVLDIPQSVKDYIQKAKVHMSQACQDMEAGLNLTSHYVDVEVIQREILRSGKNTNKCLDKELVIMGDTDRQKSLLGQSQIFESSNGDKPKRYILLFSNAGMGKTTLIKKLCLDWSRDCIPQFDFVFLLDGKALTITEPTYSLQTLLLNLSSFAPSCIDSQAVYAQILAAPKRVLIIFDGFEQLRDYEILLQTQEKDLFSSLQKDSKAQTYTVRQLYAAILQRALLQGSTLLLSTRPRGTASQLLRRADSLLEMSGFTPTYVESYLSQYFTDPALRASALDCLQNSSYLHLLCWNPGLCRLVCLVLEQSKSSGTLPRTLTGLCHQVLRLKMERDCSNTNSQAEAQAQISIQCVEETQTHVSSSTDVKRRSKNTQRKSRTQVHTRSRTQRARRAKAKEKEADDLEAEEMKSGGGEIQSTEDKELLSQVSSLAWDGVKANSSVIPAGRTISAKLKAFGLRTGLFLSHHLRTTQFYLSGETDGAERKDGKEIGGGRKGERRVNRGSTDVENSENILLWANPFLQSYLAGVHLSLSRTVSDRSFLQTLPFQSGPKGRRRPQREELELTLRFAVGLLFHNRTELQRLHLYTETTFRDMVVSKQGLVTKHIEELSHVDMSPAQILEACHYVYEASFTHDNNSRDSGGTRLATHLAANLPEVLTFHGVSLSPLDTFAVQKILERGGTEGRSFCLDLEDSGIQISGLRALVGLSDINTYRACIADVITLWGELKQSGEEVLLQQVVSKFKIHPLKATQVCHIDHLAKLVNIHVNRRLSDSSSQSDSILAEGVPAVKELHKLEFALGPESGPLALPKLWELLPGLNNLQHLDLEKSKIDDKGAEKLAEALVSLCSLEILNLSQNCIGDEGVKKLTATLRDLPKMHHLSLYSNVISDEGAESLAAALPHMASLTELDVAYNKLTDVGAQSLGASLRNCKRIKILRMWNQCIPYGVFERLQQQDQRIAWH